jgi:radical SAM superfamily enzyme YgiQ (UPF0313 family)
MAPSKKRYSLLLINPKRKYRYHWDLKEICTIMRKKTAVHPLSLPTVAALTPAHYDITILDEEIEPITFDKTPDIVGITAMIPNIKRAYEIADTYRSAGVPVVMGGAQVSFNVEETLTHAETVVVGEAEGVWEHCLNDFEIGRLKPVYKAKTRTSFKKSPMPRWDLVKTKDIMALGVQVSRGCPFSCDFCLVRNMFGKEHRYRDIDNVIEEIKNLPKKQITFTDDNLTANKPYARELMKRLKPLGVSWMCQASIELADDEKLLQDMADAGCTAILVGIESLNPKSLKETHKFQNKVNRYETAVKRVHSVGINVVGSFIVGFDADTLEAFDDIYNFTARNNIFYIMLNVLTVYPGTDLYERMKKEGRLNYTDPDLLNGIFPTMRFKNMSQTDVFDKYFETMNKMFSYDHVRKKALEVQGNGAFQKFNEGEIGPLDKFLSLVHLTKMFLFSLDKSKRRMLVDLFSLVFKKKACVGVIVETLMFSASFQGYLRYIQEQRDEILEKIMVNDLGPWLIEEKRSEDDVLRKSYIPQTNICATSR